MKQRSVTTVCRRSRDGDIYARAIQTIAAFMWTSPSSTAQAPRWVAIAAVLVSYGTARHAGRQVGFRRRAHQWNRQGILFNHEKQGVRMLPGTPCLWNAL